MKKSVTGENLTHFLSIAKKAASKAGELILTYYERGFHVQYKGEIDLVTDADRASQDAIYEMIKKEFPAHSFLGEEGLSLTQESSYKWIIDPLDGTTNFVHGYPKFAVSIGLEIEGAPSLGVIYDPCLEELFCAATGHGAFLNDRQIRVSAVSDLRKAFLVTGFPYHLSDPEINNIPYFNHLVLRSQAIRRDGSAALDLAYLACGRFDGFWELGLAPWDMAAGSVLVKEAGGTITNFKGEPHSIYTKMLLASNGALHNSLLQELRAAEAGKA